MNQETKKMIMAEARCGERVKWVAPNGIAKMLYPGFGNAAGLHSYLAEAKGDVWTSKGGLKLQAKLDALTEGRIVIERFYNVTRDLGRWLPAEEIHVASTNRNELERGEHRQQLFEIADRTVYEMKQKRAKSRAKKGMGSFPSGW